MSKMPDPRDLHMTSMRFDKEVIEGYELPKDPEIFKNAKVTKQGYRAQRALASPDQFLKKLSNSLPKFLKTSGFFVKYLNLSK
jgi:hypothetical protein